MFIRIYLWGKFSCLKVQHVLNDIFFYTKCDMIDFVFRKGLIRTTFSWGGRRSCQGHSESMIQTSSPSGQKFMVLVREEMMMMMMMMTVQFSSCLLMCWLNSVCASYKASTATQIHRNKMHRKKNETYSSSSKTKYWRKSPMLVHQITLYS
jgi:hypothetical protein